MLCQIVVGPQFQNSCLLMLPLSLVAGPLTIWSVTLKSAQFFFYETFLKPAIGGNIFLDFLKAKNEVLFKKIYFDLLQIKKNSFAHFWKIKINIKQNLLKIIFLYIDCSLMYKEGFYKFSLKNLCF